MNKDLSSKDIRKLPVGNLGDKILVPCFGNKRSTVDINIREKNRATAYAYFPKDIKVLINMLETNYTSKGVYGVVYGIRVLSSRPTTDVKYAIFLQDGFLRAEFIRKTYKDFPQSELISLSNNMDSQQGIPEQNRSTCDANREKGKPIGDTG